MALHRASGNRALGALLATTTLVLWGMLPVLLKLLLRAMDAGTITWFRFLLSALALYGLLRLRRALPRLSRLERVDWVLLAVATLGLAANYVGFLFGLELSTPANTQVIMQLAPLLLAVGGIAVFRERFAGAQWLGFAVLVAGLALFFGSQLRELAGERDRYLLSSALLAGASIVWAGYGLAQKQLLQRLPSQALMLCIYAGCCAVLLPIASPSQLAGLDALGVALLLFAALNTLVAYGAFSASLEHLEASRVSAILALTPLATLAFANLAHALWPQQFAPDALSIPSAAGAFLVMVGSLVTALAGSGAAVDPPAPVSRDPSGR